MESNGSAPKTRVDFNIRVVADVTSYAQAGSMMDTLAGVLASVLEGRAHYDFTNFQTHPCKAAQMERLSMMATDQEVPLPSFVEPSF